MPVFSSSQPDQTPRRRRARFITPLLLVALILGATSSLVHAQSDDPETLDDAIATIRALETQVAELQPEPSPRERMVVTPRTQTSAAAGGALPSGQFGDIFIGGDGELVLPDGEPGALSVVAVGPYDFSLPIVVRNTTEQAYERLEVSVSAFVDGALIAVGGSILMQPATLAPGSIAFGEVYLDGVSLPSNVTFEHRVTGQVAPARFSSLYNAQVTEATYLQDRIVGQVTNTGAEALSLVSIEAACFSLDGTFQGIATTFLDQSELAPGESAPYQISLRFRISACERFAVAASGFAF